MPTVRAACLLTCGRLSRTSWRTPPEHDAETQALSARIVELAHKRRRFGYRRIHDLLRAEGRQVNHSRCGGYTAKQSWPCGGARRLSVRSVNAQHSRQATRPNEVWSMDFVMGNLANARRLKCLTVADDYTHESVDITVDHGTSGDYVVRVLEQAARFRGHPRAIRTDGGQKFTSRAFLGWAHASGIEHFID